VDAFKQYVAVERSCLRQPQACDPAQVNAVASEPLAPRVLSVVNQKAANGLIGVPGAIASYQVVLDVSVEPGATTGTLTACSVDGDINMRINDPSDPNDDEVDDDRVVSRVWTFTYKVIDGMWKATDVGDQERWEGVNQCPPPDA